MSWSIGKFRKQITEVSFNQYFEVHIVFPEGSELKIDDVDYVTALARTTELPSKTLETQNVSYYGADFKVNAKATFSDWNVTFMETPANTREVFLKWTDIAYNMTALQNNAHKVYKSNNCKVFKLDTSGAKEGVRFYGLWPTSVGALSFDQTGGSILTYDVTFSYDYFERESAVAPPIPAPSTE